jgi:hypothetical protein
VKAIETDLDARIGRGASSNAVSIPSGVTFSVASQVRASLGAVGAPGYSFTGDLDTGMYSSGADSINFAAAGVQSLQLTGTAVYPIKPIYNQNGLVGTPSYTFDGDTDTGIYHAGSNDLGLVAGGTLCVEVSSTKTIFNALVLAGDGLVGTPAFSFGADQDTGMWRNGADTLAFALGGVNKIQFEAGGVHPLVRIQGIDGSAATPAYTFDSDTDTGLYRVGANSTGIALGGEVVQLHDRTATNFYASNAGTPVLRWQIDQGGFNASNSSRIYNSDGTALLPCYSFGSDTNSGMYWLSADDIGFAVGGVRVMDIATTFVRFLQDIIPNADNTQSCGKTGARWTSVWAANGTIQTSMSETKSNVEPIFPEAEVMCKVPMPALFTRPGQKDDEKRLGWLADNLPIEAHPVIGRDEAGNPIRDMETVYTDAILAMHSLALRNDYERFKAQDEKIATLEARLATFEERLAALEAK